MSLRERLEEDLKDAMRARQNLVRDTLRMTLSELKKAEIDRNHELSEAEELELLGKAAKTRQESQTIFAEAGREDLAQKEAAELEVIQRYLPEALSEEALREVVRAAIAELGIASKKDLGRLMKAVMAEHKGRADGRRVQALAAELLDAGPA